MILQILPAAAHSWDTSRIFKIIFSSIDCISYFFNVVHFTGSFKNNQTLYEFQFTHFLLALTKGIFKYSKTPKQQLTKDSGEYWVYYEPQFV